MNKKTLSRKQLFFNKINLTEDDELYVGIDVHKKSYHIALWLNDAPAIDYVMSADAKKLIETLRKVQSAIKNIVYEAGPTGYSLARQLKKADLPVQVIAPSKTPRASAKDSKTDRIDARKLAQYAAKGLLRPIAVPTVTQEADRQLCRAREQLVKKQTRVKLQIKSLLLLCGLEEPKGLKYWTNYAIVQLKHIKVNEQLRFSIDLLLAELEFIKNQLKQLEQKLKELFSKTRHKQKIEYLQTHPGVGQVTARKFITEIFKPKRFKNKTELAKYVGLCPHISQSGQTKRDGPILKTGRPQLRCNLIEAAWVWIARDPAAGKIYKRLLHNTGQANKAITAMARKMAINLWKMLCNNTVYVQPE